MRVSRLAPVVLGLVVLLSPVVAAQEATPIASPVAGQFGSLRFLGEQRVPNDLMVDGTLVGGLSGIDYDPVTGEWVIISDDRSEHGPARFYTAALEIGEAGFSSVEIRLNQAGVAYTGAGHYEDVYRRVSGRWRFERRELFVYHWVPLAKGWA